MKYLFTITVVLISYFVHAQTDTTFNNIYSPYYGTTTICSVLQKDSFYYSAFVQRGYPDLIQRCGMLKINLKGQIVDSSLFIFGDTNVALPWGNSLSITHDNYFLLAGSSLDSSGTVRGVLIKVDSSLNMVWSKWFNHPDTAIASQAIPSAIVTNLTVGKETPDGGYILGGEYNYQCTGNTDRGLLIKTDTSGNFEWYKVFGAQIRDVEIDPIDSGYFFPGWNNYVNKFTKTNKYGDVLWTMNFNTNLPYPYKPVGPFDIEIIDSNNLVVVSSSFIQTTPSSGYNKHIVVTKVNTINKSIVWEKVFSPYDRFMNITLLQSINVDKYFDNSIIISGTSWVTDSLLNWNSQRGIILSIDNNGDSLWSRYYSHLYSDGDDKDTQLNDLAVCDDGGFLLGGFYDTHSMYDNCWLVKTDSLGYAPAAFTVGIENDELIISKPKLLIYPNPTSDNINLSMEENPKEDLQLELYNISGQLILEKRLPSFEKVHRVNIQHLKSGVYLVKLVSDTQVIYSSEIIKE